MLQHKKTTLLFLISISCLPILGMFSRMRRQHIHLLVGASGKTIYSQNHKVSTQPKIKKLSNEKLEQWLRNNYLSPNNILFALANTGRITPPQIEAVNEWKQRQRNKELLKEKEVE